MWNKWIPTKNYSLLVAAASQVTRNLWVVQVWASKAAVFRKREKRKRKGSLQFQLHNPDDKFWSELQKKKSSTDALSKPGSPLGFACSCSARSGLGTGQLLQGCILLTLCVSFFWLTFHPEVTFFFFSSFFAHECKGSDGAALAVASAKHRGAASPGRWEMFAWYQVLTWDKA